MTGRLKTIVMDAPDISRLARFYEELCGWARSYEDPGWITLTTPDGFRVALQHAPDHVAPRWPDPAFPQQVHLDLLTHDVVGATRRAVTLGASDLLTGEVDPNGIRTLADPAGHPFDLCYGGGDGGPIGVFSITIDCPDVKELAHFYADLLGMQLRYESSESSLIGRNSRQLMFQRVETYNPPRWPDPTFPQQVHLDIDVSDLAGTEASVLAAGASLLRDCGSWRVYADPAGHPFCLVVP